MQHRIEQLHQFGREGARPAVEVEALSRRGEARQLRPRQLLEAPVSGARLLHREEAGREREEAHAQRVHVRQVAVVRHRREHLGGAVRLGAAKVAELLGLEARPAVGAGAVGVREAEVDDLELVRLRPARRRDVGDQHVLELQVAVGDAAGVQVLHAGEELGEVDAAHLLGDSDSDSALLLDLLKKLAARRRLHHDVVHVPLLDVAAEAN
eukprot:CAMPEP_0206179746 /NCGR_PEP_ID=MMETSP1474-20131121/67482_1 /ASSEMBLY_ACC=CAM_ASM_001110 /TAXON_ID=97495 /ORGANISM="Imantonia sp., Strain RCC918" /LENGTH=209 /DNA_ID=CAMNT_0053593045 /DNA_START=383 /DNA_END=1009 /DNA_ORIENTATION=+